MRDKKVKTLITIPASLLKKIDRLAKKAGMDRSNYVCAVIEAKMFADEMKAAYGESK
jgi:metal-responsive CopG/Arc/MetJ family transcriptional regulator